MLSKRNTKPQCLRLPSLLRLSGVTLIAAMSLFLLAGCGGGGNNSSSGGSSNGNNGGGSSSGALAGTYQGVGLTTSGPSSPDAGTLKFTIDSTGALTGSFVDYTGDGSTSTFSGTVSSTGATVTNVFSGTLSQNAATHVFSANVTQKDGSKSVIQLGIAPTASTLAGSYVGTATATGGNTLPFALTISPTGAVTGTAGTLSADPNTGFKISGYADASNNIYLAYASGGTPANSVGQVALSGTTLTGALQEHDTDGQTSNFTLSLTKQ